VNIAICTSILLLPRRNKRPTPRNFSIAGIKYYAFFQGHIQLVFVMLGIAAVFGAAVWDLLRRRFAASIVQFLKSAEAVARVTHHVAGLTDVAELPGQLRYADLSANSFRSKE